MKPRILFVSHCLPFPPHSGVTNRTYNILRQLAKEFDVHVVAFSRRNHQPDAAARASAIAGLQRIPVTVAAAIPIGAEWSGGRRLWDHLRSVITRRAYTFYELHSGDYRRELRKAVVRVRPDMIHVDNVDLFRWVGELPPVPIACTYHNIESELLRLRARHTQSPLIRYYLLHQAELVERAERELAPRVQLNVMTSALDGDRLRALAPAAAIAVIPNGADTDYFTPPAADQSIPGRTAFVGPIYMFANRDGVDQFVESTWPQVRAGCAGASFEIIGRCSDERRQFYNALPGVTAVGHVPDLRPHLAAARCAVVPLRVGGGTRLKILDAWAMGRAVVSTSLGCEGLETRDGDNILIRDTPREFAAAVLEVLGDADRRAALERSGRATVLERYSWDVVGRQIRAAYLRLLGHDDARGARASAA